MSPSLRNILVPTDFSAHSANAIEYACSLARDSKAQVHLIHVIADSSSSNGKTEKIRTRLEQLGNSLDEQNELDVKTIKKVIPGEPLHVITEYARKQGIDMIVMGTHGRTGLSHFALGSVAERVIRTSICPVLVMGPREEERDVTLVRVAETISDELGETFESEREEGLEKMRTLLKSKLHLPAVSSINMVNRLLKNNWLTWEDGDPGTWSVIEGIDFVEEETTPELPREPESQAIEIIQRARRLRATDIHIDPGKANEIIVRFRIDGKLEEYCRLNSLVGEHLQNQLKNLADLNIAEPFRPQEGRLQLPDSLSDIEVRITTARVAAGDAIAMRLFDGNNIFLALDSLGLRESALQSVDEMLRIGEGLVLVTGPTGSGKTTTVYSMLETLGGIETNVVSVEDPVEFAVPFVRQMGVDAKHGITMTSGLRTILRMDPDVVFVGEIRDVEAAHIAMRAASSGKYVLSTLHTRDVASTITALRDMNIGDRSAAGNLTGIINQRLLRRLCANCKKRVELTSKQIAHFESADIAAPSEIYVPTGCEMCRETGFRGRIGVFEVALMDEKLSNAVAGGDSESFLKDCIRSSGVVSLTADALTKAADGITSLEEALSVHWLG